MKMFYTRLKCARCAFNSYTSLNQIQQNLSIFYVGCTVHCAPLRLGTFFLAFFPPSLYDTESHLRSNISKSRNCAAEAKLLACHFNVESDAIQYHPIQSDTIAWMHCVN